MRPMMNQEIEIEFKNLLEEEEYKTLLKQLFDSSSQEYVQKNVYFDTEDFLLREHLCALRIRLKDDYAEMTLKTPFDGHHKELNLALDMDEAQKIIQEGKFTVPEAINTILKKENLPSIHTVTKIAELKTKRIEKMTDDGLIVLDKSWYADQVDYELEVESHNIETGDKLFQSILSSFTIPKRKTANKIARAFQAIRTDKT